jgi:two-component system response regulator YesN
MAALRVICQNQYLTVKELARVYEGSISDVLKLCDLLISLASAYQDKEYLTYMKTLNDIEKIFSKTYISLDEDKKKSILSFIMRTVSCKIKPEDKPAIWLKQLHKAGEVLLLEAQKLDSSSSDLVNRVILFIEQNYADEISLGQIAENLNITASYLSNLFHRTTNTTFLKYLTKFRMLKAKELLTDSSNQVKQVAEQVGYYSTRHFTKLFKEFYGCYPSEFRKKLASEIDIKGE